MTQQIKLANISSLYKEMFGSRPQATTLQGFIKQYCITVVSIIPLGKGDGYFMSQEQYDSILRNHNENRRDIRSGQKHEDNPGDLHLAVLEKRIEEQSTVIAGQTQALQMFEKSHNLLVDRLNEVLKQLGVVKPGE